MRWLVGFLLLAASAAFAADDLVEIRSFDASIKIELRYAGEDNIAGYPLYPKDFKAMAQRRTAAKLRAAQLLFRRQGLGLKIWDAYRTPEAQAVLWKLHPDPDFVANPAESGGSIHTWGAAVDVTLIDFNSGRELRMPSDFDEFGPQAAMHYSGTDAEIRRNVRTLQNIMYRVGFQGIRTEWWHFVDEDWKRFRPVIIQQAVPTPAPSPSIQVAPTPAPTRTPAPENAPVTPVPTPSMAPRTMRPPSGP